MKVTQHRLQLRINAGLCRISAQLIHPRPAHRVKLFPLNAVEFDQVDQCAFGIGEVEGIQRNIDAAGIHGDAARIDA